MHGKTLVRRTLRRFGYDIVQAHWSATSRRMQLMERYRIDLVLDVGANRGQYATQLREMGYRGAIVSFEPLTAAFAILQTKTRADSRWQAVPLALGDTDEETVINISLSDVNSSLLPLSETARSINTTAEVVQQQAIRVCRLDSVASAYIPDNANVFLKIDTQGFEARVLRGAAETLKRVHGVQMEMSFTPLYQGESGMLELLETMMRHGFTLMSTEQVYSDVRTGRQYQIDGIFFREPMP